MSLSLLRFATVAMALGVSSATGLRSSEEQSWKPAQQTQLPGTQIGAMLMSRPTEAPGAELRKRATSLGNTCGYVAANSAITAITCQASQSCTYEDQLVGCARGQTSFVPATCYDRTQSNQASAESRDVWWCSNSAYPYCAPVTYDKGDKQYAGYTWWQFCADKGVSTFTAFYSQADASSAAAAGVGSSSGGGSVPAAAIVGAVIGVIVLLAGLAIVLFCILRSKRNRKAAGRTDGGVRMDYVAVNNPTVAPQQQYQPMGQQPHQPMGQPAPQYPAKFEPSVNVASVPGQPAVNSQGQTYYEAPGNQPQYGGHGKY